MAITVDEFLHETEGVRPLVRKLLDDGLVLVENPHEPWQKPHHSFFMGRTTVSQALWTALMGNNPSVYRKDDPVEAERYPVDDVSIKDCLDFISRLNNRKEVKAKGLLFRLPKGAEWRFACRAGGEPYQSGKLACANEGIRLEEVAWYKGNFTQFPVNDRDLNSMPRKIARSAPQIRKVDPDGVALRKINHAEIRGPRPMGCLLENEFGLFDMFGNLWEWTLERGATQGELWGGSWADDPEACDWRPRKAFPKRGDGVTGLRLVAVRKAGRKKSSDIPKS